jgi:hypothetical protein
MRSIQAAQFVHLLSTGVLTGILFGDRWGVSSVRTQLPASCFVEFQQGLHVNFVPLMPILWLSRSSPCNTNDVSNFVHGTRGPTSACTGAGAPEFGWLISRPSRRPGDAGRSASCVARRLRG